jgi:hypothetical protein
VRFSLEGVRRHGGYVCFQAFTRSEESRVECTRVPRSVASPDPDPGPVGPDKADGATDPECAAHADSPETCATTSGCAVGVAEACHDADAACADRTSERTCWQAPECRWSGGVCSPRGSAACNVNNTRIGCFYTPGCWWFVGECLAPPVIDEDPCQLRDAFTCEVDGACIVLDGNRCEDRPCDFNGDSLTCEEAGCYWWRSSGCEEIAPTSCGEGYDEGSCGSITYLSGWGFRGCEWIDSLDLCVELPRCEDQHDALSCTTAGCTWLNFMGCL